MEGKTCIACAQEKPIEAFGIRNDIKSGRSGRCRQCHTAYKRAWMDRNPDSQKRYNRKRRDKVREIVHHAKDSPCVDCRQRYPYWVMDFDHVRGVKKFNIAPAKGNRRTKGFGSYQDLHDEIAKCDVVCANCHRLRHAPVL